MPIPNRYFGCFQTGKLKYRGIEARRHDQAPFVQRFQLDLLERLARARSLAECRAMREELVALVRDAVTRLRNDEVPLEELMLRRKTSLAAEEYCGNGMTAVAARQAKRAGIHLHAGEAVCFVVTSAGDRDADSRLRLPCLMQPEETYDPAWYVEQLRRAAATVLEPLLGEPLSEILGIGAKPRNKRAPQSRQLNLFDAWAAF
jgi:DNA polymerase-2